MGGGGGDVVGQIENVSCKIKFQKRFMHRQWRKKFMHRPSQLFSSHQRGKKSCRRPYHLKNSFTVNEGKQPCDQKYPAPLPSPPPPPYSFCTVRLTLRQSRSRDLKKISTWTLFIYCKSQQTASGNSLLQNCIEPFLKLNKN